MYPYINLSNFIVINIKIKILIYYHWPKVTSYDYNINQIKSVQALKKLYKNALLLWHASELPLGTR